MERKIWEEKPEKEVRRTDPGRKTWNRSPEDRLGEENLGGKTRVQLEGKVKNEIRRTSSDSSRRRKK